MPHTYADLLALADAAEIVVDQQPSPAANPSQPDGTPADSPTTPEADDDPHRLARVNLDRYATRTDGRTLAYWREEWYVWKRNCYRKISDRELRAKLSASIKEEFDRLCRERQATAAESARDGRAASSPSTASAPRGESQAETPQVETDETASRAEAGEASGGGESEAVAPAETEAEGNGD